MHRVGRAGVPPAGIGIHIEQDPTHAVGRLHAKDRPQCVAKRFVVQHTAIEQGVSGRRQRHAGRILERAGLGGRDLRRLESEGKRRGRSGRARKGGDERGPVLERRAVIQMGEMKCRAVIDVADLAA